MQIIPPFNSGVYKYRRHLAGHIFAFFSQNFIDWQGVVKTYIDIVCQIFRFDECGRQSSVLIDIQVLIPGTCESVFLYYKREIKGADGIKVAKQFTMNSREYPGLKAIPRPLNVEHGVRRLTIRMLWYMRSGW